jgi:asparagine synthase (glutamine-hydrolysing)
MCGIAGYDGRFGPGLLERMSAMVAHRGPDDQGTWTAPDGSVGLAHRRLAILDLSPLGHQPMHDRRGGLTIAYNGEIYNFPELRAELEAEGLAFKSRSDTEVLLEGYRVWGERLLAKLNGIFAFALWDAAEKTLLVVRDGAGVKPLYFTETPQGFLFASEMKAILCEPSVPREIDPRALECHLVYLWAPTPLTMLRAVRKLEPGTALVVRRGRIERRLRFYTAPSGPPDGAAGAAAPAPEEAISAVRRTLERAVERQMLSDVPVGAFLSGGLDSSAVVALARRHTPERRLQCFTIDLAQSSLKEEGITDDLPYARQAARALDVDLHEIRVGPEMTDELEAMVYHLDEPQADPAPLNVLFISRLARRHGIKVLLSGAGGDDLFAGYRRHLALRYEALCSGWPEPLRASLRSATSLLPARGGFLRRVRRAFQYADRTPDQRLLTYFFWIDPARVRSLYAPAWAASLDGWECGAPLLETLARLPAGTPPLARMLSLEFHHFLADHNLNYTDKMAMACGVEVRVPFLDPDLVALAAGLPDSLKIRGGSGKWILKEAVRDLLPGSILTRPKSGFGAPLRTWLRGPLRPMVDDLLSDRSLRARGVFEPVAVWALVDADRRGRVDAAYTILAMLCIELWCRRFLDRAAA